METGLPTDLLALVPFEVSMSVALGEASSQSLSLNDDSISSQLLQKKRPARERQSLKLGRRNQLYGGREMGAWWV